MPPYTQHLAKAKSNLSFVDFLGPSQASFLDWVILGYFLTALHHVEAYFDFFYGKSFGNHTKRRRAIIGDTRLANYFSCYRQLETYSQTARYGIKQFNHQYIQRRVIPQFQKLRTAIESFDHSLKL